MSDFLMITVIFGFFVLIFGMIHLCSSLVED